MKEDELKQFFIMMYEDLQLFNLDKQRITYECGRYNLICNITFEVEKREDEK